MQYSLICCELAYNNSPAWIATHQPARQARSHARVHALARRRRHARVASPSSASCWERLGSTRPTGRPLPGLLSPSQSAVSPAAPRRDLPRVP